jgi:hypothetical protein
LREFLSCASSEKRNNIENWIEFLVKRKVLEAFAHQLPFNVAVLFDLMSILKNSSVPGASSLYTACHNCEVLQFALLWIDDFCDIADFIRQWPTIRASWSSEMTSRNMFAFMRDHSAKVLKFKDWCRSIGQYTNEVENIVSETIDKINEEYSGNLFANLTEIGFQLQQVPHAVPTCEFEMLMPPYANFVTRFRFVSEPNECCICLEPILVGISPCPNSVCGLNANFGGTKQYCHYQCFRSHAWSFQYTPGGIHEHQQPVRCMLCNTSFELQQADLALTQFLPADLVLTAPEIDLSGCYTDGTFTHLKKDSSGS